MDPKLSNLDPKLQDAYNRVMGTAVSGQNPPSLTQATPQPSQSPDPIVTSPFSQPLNQNPNTMNQNPYSNPIPASQMAPAQSYNQTQVPTQPQPQQPTYNPLPPILEPMQPPAQPTINITQPIQEVQVPPPVAVNPMPNPVPEVQAPPPASSPIQEPVKTSTSTPAPALSAPNTPSTTIPGVNSTLAFNATDSNKNVGTTPINKRNIKMMPVLIGLGIVLLLVVYTFVWVILFKVQIPFIGKA